MIILFVIYWLTVMCCTNNEPDPQEYRSILSLSGYFNAYDPGIGVYNTPPFNRNHLNIQIFPDSVSRRIAAQSKGLVTGVYACQDPYRPAIYENTFFIEEIITVLPINDNYPAGSRINSILSPLSNNTILPYSDRIIDSLSVDNFHIRQSYPYVEFSLDVPVDYDSAQFRINGEIEGLGAISFITEKVMLK